MSELANETKMDHLKSLQSDRHIAKHNLSDLVGTLYEVINVQSLQIAELYEHLEDIEERLGDTEKKDCAECVYQCDGCTDIEIEK